MSVFASLAATTAPMLVPDAVFSVTEPVAPVAMTAAPMLVPTAVFSAIERVAVAPSVNTGASLTSVTLIVTAMLSDNVPSDTVTVTV